jgi:hypothetical protein
VFLGGKHCSRATGGTFLDGHMDFCTSFLLSIEEDRVFVYSILILVKAHCLALSARAA